MSIVKLVWYLVSLIAIFLILINNPKAAGLGNLSSQGKIFNSTRSTEKKLQILTIGTVVIFFIFTIILASNIIF
uniref:Probable protein-export membrane protein SecG n=1 Tax=Ahnfeltia plicata TaxID=28023 RepID=A0A1C9CAU1_9FLOR|nr:preprotein translocase subunit G [Ahnfeltia plicata]AOM65501.1 preprotein translocase subunit G [Ahnfeltia plicata]UAT97275.1 preprotein translocase subunit G [Ahnfeltia plicata]UAT97480.1 preprotein translocase subunit G [Ahnfeltia plicata]